MLFTFVYAVYVIKLILAHTWLALGFVSKTECDRSGIRAMLTVGRKPRIELVVIKDFAYLFLLSPFKYLQDMLF